MSLKAMFGAIITLILAVGGVAVLSSSGLRPVVDPKAPTLDDSHPTNPFEGKSASKDAKVKVEETHFDYGRMALGDSMSHDFVFTNVGTVPLLLAKGPIQCKCTMPTVGSEPVAPGQSVKISLSWTPVEASKDFQKEAVIWTNDLETPRVVLGIHGAVAPDPSVLPGSFTVGNIRWDKANEFDVALVSMVAKDLKVEGIETSHPEFQAEVQPWEARDYTAWVNPEMVDPMIGYYVHLKLLPVKKSGPFTGSVTLKTNHKKGDVKIPIDGIRVGPIGINHAQYQSAKAELHMGRFKSEEGKELMVRAFMEPFGEELKITGVESEPKHLKFSATLKKDAKITSASKEYYELTVQVPPGLPKGGYPVPPLLKIKTNHPEAPELVIKLMMIVQ